MSTDKQNDDYKPVKFYKDASEGRQRGFVKFSDDDLHYFAYLSGGDIAMISQAYTTIAGRDNGIESVRKNMKTEARYRFSKQGSQHRFGLFARNGQEVAVSPLLGNEKDAKDLASRAMGKSTGAAKPAKAKAASVKPAKATAKKTSIKKTSTKKTSSGASDGRIENYKPLAYYQERSGKIDDGFGSFSDGDAHFFTYHQNGKIVLISESYTSRAGRDNGIVSVKKNMPIKERYEHHKHKNGKYYFDLNAGNRQEIATSVWYSSSAAALTGAAMLRGEVTPKKATATKAAATKGAATKTKAANVEDNYHPLAFYEKHGNNVKEGFDTFEHDGQHYFTFNRAGKIVLLSESYPTKAARETGRASVEKNMKIEGRYDYRTLKNGKHDYRIKARNGKEIARSVWYSSAAAAATGAAYLLGTRKAAPTKAKKAPSAAAAPVMAAAAVAASSAAAKTPKDKDDDYLACKEYHDRDVTDKANNVALFRHENGQFYFALYDDNGDMRLRSEGFRTAAKRDSELSAVLRLKDDERYYKKITRDGHYMDVLYDETGREVGRSCLKRVAPIVAAAPIAAAAATASVAPAVAAAPVAAAGVAAGAATLASGAAGAGAGATSAAATGGGLGWLKWLLLGLLALLAIWGLSRCFAGSDAVTAPPSGSAAMVTCWDGSDAASEAACPTKVECADGSFASTASACPVPAATEPTAAEQAAAREAAAREATLAENARAAAAQEEAARQAAEREAARQTAAREAEARVAAQRAQAVRGSITRSCGPSDVTLFDVPSYLTPKSVTYLGSNPQFGDSHALSPSQFYDKLNTAYARGGADRAFLNYTARALGYSGFRAMDASMFSNDSLARGETGLLGFSQSHALQYSKLNTNDRDREAFRVRSANGQDIHFMKTCGNFMYVCQ